MIQVEQRASTVLYKFLISNCKDYHFLIPANVCSVVPLTFLKADVDFSFVDIDFAAHAGSFDGYKESIVEHRDQKVGVLFVNAYGAPHDTKQFYQDIRSMRDDLVIIEDDCLCIPETHRTCPVDNVDLEFYSTGYSKFVQMPMEGGFGLIRDGFAYKDYHAPFNDDGYTAQQKKIKACRKSGDLFLYEENDWLPSESVITDNYSVKDYIQEVERRVSISKAHKQKINDIYSKMLPDELKMGDPYNSWRYILILPSSSMRDAIMDALFEEDLYASLHYQSAAYLYKHVHCLNTEEEEDRLLNLFNEEKYTFEMAMKTVEIINDIYKNYDK